MEDTPAGALPRSSDREKSLGGVGGLAGMGSIPVPPIVWTGAGVDDESETRGTLILGSGPMPGGCGVGAALDRGPRMPPPIGGSRAPAPAPAPAPVPAPPIPPRMSVAPVPAPVAGPPRINVAPIPPMPPAPAPAPPPPVLAPIPPRASVEAIGATGGASPGCTERGACPLRTNWARFSAGRAIVPCPGRGMSSPRGL